MVKIRAYNASGKLYTESGSTISIDSFTLGTRVLLTCDVTGLPEGSEVIRYKWYHKCTGAGGRCEIQEGTSYYRAVNDTLLVDVTSQDFERRHYCDAEYGNMKEAKVSTEIHTAGWEIHQIIILCKHACSVLFYLPVHSAASPGPFLYTSTSLLLNHALITDAHQVKEKDGKQWINCTSGGNQGHPQIFSTVNQNFASSQIGNSATSELNSYTRNGRYYCFRQSTKTYFSVYLKNLSKQVDAMTLTNHSSTLTHTL